MKVQLIHLNVLTLFLRHRGYFVELQSGAKPSQLSNTYLDMTKISNDLVTLELDPETRRLGSFRYGDAENQVVAVRFDSGFRYVGILIPSLSLCLIYFAIL